jgi:predicted  nucleic acid-binding Zn-ribbon protein
MSRPSPLILALGVGAAALVLAGLGYGGYVTRNAFTNLSNELATTTAARNTLADELAQAREENMELSQRLADELAKNTTFENQISDIASTVGTLTKLSQTDKELLQKYSRVYFLKHQEISHMYLRVHELQY